MNSTGLQVYHRSLIYAVSGGQALGSGASSKGQQSIDRVRGKQRRQSHLIPCGFSTGPPLCDTSRSLSVRALRVVLRGCLTEKIADKNRRTLSHERFCP